MRLNRVWPTIGVLFLLFVTSVVLAKGNSADAPDRLFGIGQPHSVADLPPGQLKSTLKGLSPKARGKALDWLQRFSFPAQDVDYLRVDSKGSIFYVEAVAQDTKGSSTLKVEAQSSIDSTNEIALATEAVSVLETMADSPAADPQNVFKLHSRPGSANVLFLDFDGHTLRNTAWNEIMNQSVLEALPFDPSRNDSPATVANFSPTELNRIAEIWHRIASDFAPFDIDVTTEEPAVFTSTTGHILITHSIDANGRYMPYSSSKGAAHPDVFGLSDYAYYSPALVYYTNLYSDLKGWPPAVAESASHEFGHQLGLSHDGLVGAPASYIYQGHGGSLVSWAPIMGAAYYKEVTQWDQGEYEGATNPEDDLAIIAGHLGYINDDHADSYAQATALAVDEDGTIMTSSPQLDPDNVLTENKGVIGDRDDVDWFYLDVTGSGALEITATPSWHSFTNNGERGENLDIELSLFNSNRTLIAVDDPIDNTNATVTATVNPGRYYLQLDGVGNDTYSDYSDYASIGMYFIEGSVPMDGAPGDTTPPSPAQMNWQSPPSANGTSSISMTAVTATDETSSVEYYFTCVAGGPGCNSSGWQASATYTDNGLQANTSYSYKVMARDAAGNTNIASATASATTEAPPPPGEDTTPPSPSQMSWQTPPHATGTSSISMTAVTATDDSGTVQYLFACLSGGANCYSSGWRSSPIYTASGLEPNTTYSYKVIARDAAGNRNAYSEVVSATTDSDTTPTEDTTPPSPAQMSWQSPPSATGTSSISMTAVTATDETSGVEYYFSCVSGGTGCNSSGWQTSRSYTDNGLQANTSYSYSVRARDAAGNMNSASAATSATTDDVEPPPPPASNISPTAVASYSPNPAQISRGKTVQVTLNGASSYDPDGSITAWSWKNQSGSVVSTSSRYAVKLREGNHSYTLTVTDNKGASNTKGMTVTILPKPGRK